MTKKVESLFGDPIEIEHGIGDIIVMRTNGVEKVLNIWDLFSAVLEILSEKKWLKEEPLSETDTVYIPNIEAMKKTLISIYYALEEIPLERIVNDYGETIWGEKHKKYALFLREKLKMILRAGSGSLG